MSLKEIARNRIIRDMITSVRSNCNTNQLAMVVDNKGLRLLSSCCKVYDVLQEGITVVESISKKRQQLPDLDAIYFISTDPASTKMLLNDFKNEKKPQYRNIHIFFSNALGGASSAMVEFTKNPVLLPRIKSFVELNFNFLPYESRIFHLDSPQWLRQLFPSNKTEILHEIADQLVTLFISFGDHPNIRFANNRHKVTEQLASIIHNRLSKTSKLSKKETTLIILDRSVDIIPLLAHDYGYQALAYDVINIPICTSVEEREADPDIPPDDTYEYEFQTNSNETGARKALLGEHDEVWVKYRHKHITSVNGQVRDEVSTFARDNAAAQLSKKKNLNNEDTLKAVRALPQFQEMLAKYWAHVRMSERCYKELKDRKLIEIGQLEQDLATGVDKDGMEVNPATLLSSLGTTLSNAEIGMEEKVRCLLLYFACMLGVTDDESRRMIQAAQLSLDYTAAILNFLGLGIHTSSTPEGRPGSKHIHYLSRDKERLKFFQRRAKSAEFSLSRFQPSIRDIMENAASGQLHGGQYPYVVEPDRKSNKETGSKNATLRATNIDWAWGGDSNTATEAATTKKDIFIFYVIGGITIPEMRCAYEISRGYDCDIYLGGDVIYTPHKFLTSLKNK